MNTIIEKIRAEIERRMRICERVRGEGGENQDYYHGKAVSYNETLTFLSDLEKEEKPTTAEGLEEEIDKRYLQTRVLGYQDGVGEILLGREAFGRIARHFAQWGAEHRGSSEVPTDLEEAAGEYEKKHTYQRYDGGGFTPEYDATPGEAFIAGAQWQKAQSNKELSEKIAAAYQLGLADKEKMMMKEAVEGRVVDAGLFATYNTPVEYTHSGDNVKIIIVKEDRL